MKYIKTYEDRKYKTLSRRKHLKGKVEMLVNEYAPWYDLSDYETAIYRGVKNKDGRKINQDIYTIDPSSYNRLSPDTNNLHNIIIDNSKYWIDYPNRKNSIICTTSIDYASSFGDVYRIIPLRKNSLFGSCEESDIFYCFHSLKYINDNIDNPKDLEKYLGNIFNMPVGRINSYEELSRLLTKENFNDDYKEEETIFGMTMYEFDEIVKKYGSYLDYLEYLMQPEKNGFNLFNYSQNEENPIFIKNHSHEVWTDSKCLLVREDYIKYITYY